MKRISLERLTASLKDVSYIQQYQYVCTQIENGKVKPVKASGTNGVNL